MIMNLSIINYGNPISSNRNIFCRNSSIYLTIIVMLTDVKS